MLFLTVFYRFRIPLVPLLAILAAGAYLPLKRLWRKRRSAAVALLALLAAANWALAVDPEPRRQESEHAAVARLLIDNGRFAEAEEYLVCMAKRGENARPGMKLLVTKMLREGRAAEAEATAARFAEFFAAPSDAH